MTTSNTILKSLKVVWDYLSTQYCRIMKTLKTTAASRYLMGFVIVVFILISIYGFENILDYGHESSGQIYKAIGFGIIMLWACIFICYFIWAVYFYNLNYGYTQKEWKKIEKAKDNRTQGKAFRQEDIDDEPKYNPYQDQTFGLPGGTVRGMIAFTLLFGSLALLIVSFGIDTNFQSNSFIIDQFDFFKKAFLMMIAFYFGTHSLKYLKPNQAVQQVDPDTTPPPVQPEPEKPTIVVIEPNSNTKPSNEIKMPPITAIDPMAPKG